MRIAMIGAKSVPVGKYGGGVERHVEELAGRLAHRRHTLFVYVRSYTLAKSRSHQWRGVRLIGIPTIHSKNFETIIYAFLATLHVIFMPVNVVHYHGVGPATFAWIPRLLKPSARVIVTFHSIDRFHKKWGRFARAYLGFGEWAAMHFPHQTILVSHSLQIYAHRKFKRPGIFIPNGVEPRTVRNIDELKHFKLRHHSYLLVVARLIKHKGIHFLIQAFRGLKTDKKLVVVGAPSFTEDYAAYLAKLASDDPRIILLGFQSGEILAELYAHAYLYVHPSESEGLSLTILEAMGHGTAVLISDIPENLEAIDHAGFSFLNRNVRDLRKKMEHLLRHPELVRTAALRGRNFVRREFHWNSVVRETERVYNG